jgi:hypothetical protein
VINLGFSGWRWILEVVDASESLKLLFEQITYLPYIAFVLNHADKWTDNFIVMHWLHCKTNPINKYQLGDIFRREVFSSSLFMPWSLVRVCIPVSTNNFFRPRWVKKNSFVVTWDRRHILCITGCTQGTHWTKCAKRCAGEKQKEKPFYNPLEVLSDLCSS